jgi:hypothetical protein
LSLYGSIIDLYDNGTDTELVALRTAAGQDKCYTGRPPADTELPYISVTAVSISPISQAKGNASRTDEFVVQFSVFAAAPNALATVEDLLDKIEDAYLRSAISVTSREVLTGPPRLQSRGTTEEEEIAGLWHGYIEIIWFIRKIPV